MAIVKTDPSNYLAIADAIRAKGIEGSWKPSEMADVINKITAGGGSIVFTPEIVDKQDQYRLYAENSKNGDSYGTKLWRYNLLNTTWADTTSISVNINWTVNTQYGFLRVYVGYVKDETFYSIYDSGNKNSSNKTITEDIDISKVPEEDRENPIALLVNHIGATNDTINLTFSGRYSETVDFNIEFASTGYYQYIPSGELNKIGNIITILQPSQLDLGDIVIDGVEGGKF